MLRRACDCEQTVSHTCCAAKFCIRSTAYIHGHQAYRFSQAWLVPARSQSTQSWPSTDVAGAGCGLSGISEGKTSAGQGTESVERKWSLYRPYAVDGRCAVRQESCCQQNDAAPRHFLNRGNLVRVTVSRRLATRATYF